MSWRIGVVIFINYRVKKLFFYLADTNNTKLKERYDGTIATLEKIAGMGDYTDSRIILHELPSPEPEEEETPENPVPFRMTSRPKFNHE